MTEDALNFGMVGRRIDAADLPPATPRIRELEVASGTEFTAPINIESPGILRMVQGRAMAILAHNGGMGRILDIIIFVFMALTTICRCSVFDRNGFPVCFVPFPVPAIHVPLLMDTKISRNHENPQPQDKRNNPDNHEQWSPDMAFHAYPPSFRSKDFLRLISLLRSTIRHTCSII
jgi:hypothetical protein